jgi:HJR/Mrr/RecB family endonuclease
MILKIAKYKKIDVAVGTIYAVWHATSMQTDGIDCVVVDSDQQTGTLEPA